MKTATSGGTPEYHTSIKQWPEDERPREKLARRGSEALSDAELLAILIRSGAGKVNAVDVSNTILRELGPLDQLTRRSFLELRRFHGLGQVKSLTLLAAFELGRRACSTRGITRPSIHAPEDIARIYQPLLRDLQHEVFKVILLDSANHLLRDVKVSEGILNSSLVHPREVFRHAILEPAASVILLHNHPSGNPEPSAEDLQITKQLIESGKILGIPVHDHIILTAGSYTSFAERGLL